MKTAEEILEGKDVWITYKEAVIEAMEEYGKQKYDQGYHDGKLIQIYEESKKTWHVCECCLGVGKCKLCNDKGGHYENS